MCHPSYHHSGFVATHALGHMMYGYTLLVPVSQRVLNKIIGRTHCFHDCIYIMIILILWDLSTLFCFLVFYIYLCYFLVICLFQRTMLTNTCIIYFSIKRWSDSKIWKIYFSILKLKFRRPIKYSDWSGRAHQLMPRATVSGISIQSFLLWLLSRTDQFPPLTTVNTFSFFCLFVGLFCWCVCNRKSIYNCLLEVSVDDILSQIYNNPHIYTQIHTHILTYIHTPTHLHIKFCLQYIIAVVLMISSYDKFYQQYIDSLLNYKKLEKLIAIKKKK